MKLSLYFSLLVYLGHHHVVSGNAHAHGINRNIEASNSHALRGRHGSEVGRLGASKEVEDVEDELIHMRELEGDIEKDLANILESVTKHSISLLHMEEVLSAAAKFKGGTVNNEALQKLAVAVEAHPTNLTDLSKSLIDMRRDLALLVRSINASEFELNEVREVTGQKEMVEGLQLGKVEVDYESGKIGWSTHHRNRMSRLANESATWSTTALSKQLAEATTAADPAVLHLDVQLLQDMVVLCLATGIGGLIAALADLPHTLGFILGGMLVGPSCLDFIERVVQTETLAQFGSIFMLFGHGLIYSQHYRAPFKDKDNHDNNDVAAMQNDTVTGGFVFVVVIFVVVLALVEVTGIVSTFLEGTLLALAMALSSTSVVMETLLQSRLRETLFGSVVIEVMAVQDLFMAPLLAIPTAMTHILPSANSRGELVFTVLLYASGIGVIIVLARNFVPKFMQLMSNPDRALAPQLFTLAVVSYCLGLSLLAEWLELSHEAGALFAGLVLMDTPHVQKAATAVEPLTSLFGGMYLASLGMIMSPTYLLNHLALIMTYVAAIYLLKVCVVTGVMRSFGFALPASLSAGVIMAQVSEVSLFFIARAQQLGLVSRHIYLLMLATTVTLLAVAPLASNVVKRVEKREFSVLDSKFVSFCGIHNLKTSGSNNS